MKKLFLLLALCLLVAAPGLADEDGDNAAASGFNGNLCRHQGPTATGESGLFTLSSGYTLCKGQWSFGTYYNVWKRRTAGVPGRDPLWNDWNYQQDQLSVGLGYGVSDKVELYASLPYLWYDAEGIEPNPDPAANGVPFLQGGRLNGRTYFGDIDASGLGDLRVGAKIQLAERDDFGFALNAFVDLPTGDDDEGVVTGGTGFGLGFDWSASNWIFNLGYSDPGSSDFGETSAQVDLGIGYARSLTERFEWITELVGAIKTDGDGEHDDADITTGGRLHFGEGDNWAFNFGLRVDLSDDDINSNYNPVGGLVGLTWSPKRSWDLTVSSAGECTGSVATNPGGDSCGGAGDSYACGKDVQLVATPDGECCTFDAWSGDCEGNDATTTVTLDGHKSCVAHFKKKGPYTLEVSKETVGDCGQDGSVSSRPAGISCGGTCEGEFECGSSVQLTATAVEGVTAFTGWSGDCAADGSVSMDGNKACTASFECLPPPPPVQTFDVCPKPSKKDRRQWSCDSAREIVYFDGESALVGGEQQAKLCDLVAQLNHCAEVKACITGRTAAAEHEVYAGYRADAVMGFLEANSIAGDRLSTSDACEGATQESGSWADVYLMP